MGNVVLHRNEAAAVVDSSGKKTSRRVSQQLIEAWAAEQAVVKLLLLGAGDSGKSTFMKQMKIHYQGGFSEDERKEYIRLVHANCIEFIQEYLHAARSLALTVSPALEDTAKRVLELPPLQSRVLNSESAAQIKSLLEDPAIKQAIAQRHRFNIPDASVKFFSDIDRLSHPLFIPTDSDILLCRNRTSGVIAVSFWIEAVPYRLVDVGGQRSERRKWIQCFDNVHAILFVMSLNEFDCPMFEDPTTNSMDESFRLFDDLCNGSSLETIPMVVMLNKADLLRHRIEHVNPALTFPDYTGGHSFDAFVKYVTKHMKSLIKTTARPVYFHVTCATDTPQTRALFDKVREVVLKNSLKETEFAI